MIEQVCCVHLWHQVYDVIVMTMDVLVHHQMYPTPLDVDQEVVEQCVEPIHVVTVLMMVLHATWLFYDAFPFAVSSFGVVAHIYKHNCHTWNTVCIVLHRYNRMLMVYS